MTRVLFISHDGALDPLGGSQVVPYACELAVGGADMTLLTFEKPARWRDRAVRERMAQRLRQAGVRWLPLRYHRWPPVASTAVDVARAVAVGLTAARRHRVEVLHARGYVAAAIALGIRQGHDAAFVFDMRGFWVDEREEGGLWPAGGWRARSARRFEARALAAADAVVTLTERSRLTLQTEPPLRGRSTVVRVIPTCVDLDRFQPAPEAPALWSFIYAGSAGTCYQLDRAAAFVAVVARRHPEARLTVLTPDRGPAEAAVRAAGLEPQRVCYATARHDEVPCWLQGHAVGLAWYRDGRSRQACCPTKIGESLACGLPVVVSAGVGDTDAWLAQERAGVVVQDGSDAAVAAGTEALERLLVAGGDVRARCREVAARRFGLTEGVQAYGAVYRAAVAAHGLAAEAFMPGVTYAVHGS